VKVRHFLKRYKNEWLVIEVTKRNDFGIPEEGRLLFHSANREEAWKHVPKTKKCIQVIYAGAVLKKGYAAVFGFLRGKILNLDFRQGLLEIKEKGFN